MCVDWNAVSAIATAVATGVALYASFQARSELKSALEMQEQSKNVGLIRQRIELAEKIQSGKPILEIELRILFNKDIVEHYAAWIEYVNEAYEVQMELNRITVTTGTSEEQNPQLLSYKKEAEHKAENEKMLTLQLIENFISDSIKSIKEKGDFKQ